MEVFECHEKRGPVRQWIVSMGETLRPPESLEKQLQMVRCLGKQKGVWSMWFLLPPGSRGSVRSAKAAPASWKVGRAASPSRPAQSKGAVLTEVKGDVLTQSEFLGAHSGDSFLSWVSVPPQERRHHIGGWVPAQRKYLSQTKYDHFIQ